MDKKSDVDILIEQCIQDVNNEYLEEGFVDNIKAGFNGAKEWLKADARNSFKLRNKNDMKNDRRWSARKGKVSSYAKSIANTLQDYKKSGGTLGRGMKVDDVISRLNQVAQGKYPRGEAQNSPQNQPAQEQPQQSQQTQQVQKTQQTQQPQQKPSVQNQKQETNSPKQQLSGQKPTQPSNNTVGQNKMLNSIGGNVPQENTSNKVESPKVESPNNGYSAEANELIKSFGSFSSKDIDVVDKLQGIYNNLNDDEKEKIKQQVNPDIINLINLQQNNAPWEQLNQVYGSLSPQDRGIFRVITGTKHSSQIKQDTKPEQSTPQQNNKQQPSETGNMPKAKGPSFKEKAGNTLSAGVKTVKNTLAKGTQRVRDAVAKRYNNLKDKVSAANKSQTTAPVPTPATPSTPQSQATKQPSKEALSQSEKAKKAIAKVQANIQKAKANAPKLNIPNSGKPIKRKRIINAKQNKDITAARKEQEDFHKSLGNTGSEWEERVNESFYSSNTNSQLRMLNSIR